MLNSVSIGFVHHTEYTPLFVMDLWDFLRFILVFDYVYLFVWVLSYVSAASHGLQKRAKGPLQIELEAFGSAVCGYWEPNLSPL